MSSSLSPQFSGLGMVGEKMIEVEVNILFRQIDASFPKA